MFFYLLELESGSAIFITINYLVFTVAYRQMINTAASLLLCNEPSVLVWLSTIAWLHRGSTSLRLVSDGTYQLSMTSFSIRSYIRMGYVRNTS